MEEAKRPDVKADFVEHRVQPSFFAQFRAVFLKNLTLQARQRVSLSFQLIPLLGLLISAAVLSVIMVPTPLPSHPPSCYPDPNHTLSLCWDTRSISYGYSRGFSTYDWDMFWYHDNTTGKLAGNLSRYGPLGPTYNGILGYQTQYDFEPGTNWNQTANVPFFQEKTSWQNMLEEYSYLQSNYSKLSATFPRWGCRPQGDIDNELCHYSFRIPEAAIWFDKIHHGSEGIHVSYNYATFPPLSFDSPRIDFIGYMNLFNTMLSNWATNRSQQFIQQPLLSSWQGVYLTQGWAVQNVINPLMQVTFWCIGFGLLIPFFMGKLVIERGSGLMEVSKMAGLSTTAYWGSMICTDLLQLLVATVVCVIVGLSCGFASLLHGGPLMYLAIFTYGVSVMSFAYTFSMLFKSPNWAYFFGYLVGLANAGGILPLNFLYFPAGVLPEAYFLWYPLMSASRAIFVLTHATYIPWAVDFDVATRTAGWCILWSLGFSTIMIIIPILPDLYKEISQRSSSKRRNVTLNFSENHSSIVIEDSPVQLEDEVLLNHQNPPLSCRSLSKTFLNDNGDVITAVSNVTFQIETGDCFGLLGPNGAGKTTLINMLVGYLDVSGGNAFVDGHSIITDMTGVQESLGLCPQFDVHYEDLTVQEHLLYYSRLWGFTRSNERQHVKQLIKQIGLHDEKHRKAESLSGGQKRRLSIGIALSGNPPLVLLDEPSSGLDVGSQRAVWDIICNARKQRRSFLLTTHSMAEAEVLCNRIGVMAQGKLKVTGTPQELKRRFGSGFKIDMFVDVSLEEDMKAHPAFKFILSVIPTAELVSASNGHLTFQIPKSTKLSKIMTQVEMGKKANGIINWGIGQSNLQEVFLALTRSDNAGDGDVLD